MLPLANVSALRWIEISIPIVLLAAITATFYRSRLRFAWSALGDGTGDISGRHAKRAAALAANGVIVADLRKPGYPIVYVNRAFELITGYSRTEAIGRNTDELLAEPDRAVIRDAMRERRIMEVRLQSRRKDGMTFINELHIEPLFNGWGRATHSIGTIRNVLPWNDNGSAHQRGDLLDRLTGVATRNTFHDLLDGMLRREGGEYTLLLKVDIRHFHDINTSFGDRAGDSLLLQTAQRLRKLPDAVVGRMSGDEFAIGFPLPNPDVAAGIVAMARAVLEPKFQLPDVTTIRVRFSLGYAVGLSTDDCTTLLRRAGVALHESKASRFQVTREFDRNAAIRSENRSRLTRDLQHAIERAELRLYYQPKVDLATAEIIGAEALLRWDDPAFGLLEPVTFIPAAEDSGLIVDIGAWCLRQAADFVVRLNRGRSRPLAISVNVSQLQFEYSDVFQSVRTVIEESGADPSWLMLELKEPVLTDNSVTMTKTLRQLREMGVGLSIDDFGTGYSSLSYLEAFPFSEFKIDRSFVSGIHESQSKQVIVEAMIRLGKELQISVVAEGPESEEELSVLQRLNCPYAQGYIFGRAMPEAEFLTLLSRAPSVPGERDAAPAPSSESDEEHPRTAILLEDDPLVREVVGAALEVLGWAVTPTATAEEALSLIDLTPPPQLLVTDVNLGAGMSGLEMLPYARMRWPNAGVVVISGRPIKPTALAAFGPRETFLAKPASIAALSSAISRVCGRGDAGLAESVDAARLPSWGGIVAMGYAGERVLDKPSVSRTKAAEARPDTPVLADLVAGRSAVAESTVNLAAEVHRVLSQMSRQVTIRNVRVLVAIQPDLTIRADPEAFRGIMSRILWRATNGAGLSGGRLLIAAFREQDRVQVTITDETEAADAAIWEFTLRPTQALMAMQDGSLSVRSLSGGGVRVTLSLPGT